MDPDDLRERAQALEALRGQSFTAERVTGRALNNELWRVEVNGRTLALRVPPAVNVHGIDRRAEAEAILAAASVGVTPRLVDACDAGLLLSEWVDGQECGSEDLSVPAGVLRFAEVVRTAHVPAPAGVAPLSVILARMLDRAHAIGSPTPTGVRLHLDRVREVEARTSAEEWVLTHHDPWPNNFLDGGDRLWLVDWEFAGAGDGMFDIAVLALAAGMTPDEIRGGSATSLLEFFGHSEATERLSEACWAVSLFEAIWAFAAHASRGSDGDFDYRSHADDMFARL